MRKVSFVNISCLIYIITNCIGSMEEGNIFTGICIFTGRSPSWASSRGGSFLSSFLKGRSASDQAPPQTRYPPDQKTLRPDTHQNTHTRYPPSGWLLPQSVCTLLECILVFGNYYPLANNTISLMFFCKISHKHFFILQLSLEWRPMWRFNTRWRLNIFD